MAPSSASGVWGGHVWHVYAGVRMWCAFVARGAVHVDAHQLCAINLWCTSSTAELCNPLGVGMYAIHRCLQSTTPQPQVCFLLSANFGDILLVRMCLCAAYILAIAHAAAGMPPPWQFTSTGVLAYGSLAWAILCLSFQTLVCVRVCFWGGGEGCVRGSCVWGGGVCV